MLVSNGGSMNKSILLGLHLLNLKASVFLPCIRGIFVFLLQYK